MEYSRMQYFAVTTELLFASAFGKDDECLVSEKPDQWIKSYNQPF